MNIFILDKNYNQIGMLSNEGANPQAPYFDDLYTQELDTGADTFYFTTLSTSASRDFIEIGNHIIFQFNNRHRLFAISDLEFEHKEGRNVIGVYAEGVGFQLLETFMGEFEGGDDTDGDGEVDDNSGEFLTYDMFLEKVLKDTDWNYQIMSGDLTNINMGKEVTFQNGKNIYALLQDSMQEFGGIELEFRAEYVGGSLNKTIYAYPHKGRGSFVGQRFEYGHNVAGIKKKQEIIDGLDENIILYEGLETVDGLNVEVTYEVDFALRGYEVEELEIGDTHYVIDNDFEPAQIEARIGKIEISFSDPTRNKCYIANFKKISGSKPDNIDSDNVEDIIEDNLDDKLDELIDDKLGELIGDDFKNHTHDRLVSENDGSKTPLVFKSGHGFMADNNSKWHMAHLVNSDIGLNFGATDASDHWTSVYIERSDSLANGAKKTATIFTSDGNMLPDTNNQYIGSSNKRWNAIYSNYIDAANSVSSPRYFGYNYQVRFDRDDMQNVTKVTDKQDLLDFIVNKVNVYKYSAKEVDDAVGAPDKISYQEYYGLLAEDFTTHSSNTNCSGSEVAYNIIKNTITGDTNGDGEIDNNDGHNKHTYNLPALVTTLIGAFQQHVENGDDGGGEEIDLSAYATKKYVDDAIDDIEVPDLSDYATKKYVDDAIKAIELETGASIKNIYIDSSDNLMFLLSDGTVINAGKLPSGGGSGYKIIDLPNPDWTTTLTNCFEGALIAEPKMYSDGDGQFTFIKPHIEKTDYTTNHYIEFAVHAGNYQNIDDARIYYKGSGMGNSLPTFCPAPGFATDLGAPKDDEYGSSWENVYASVGHFDKIHVNQIFTPDGSGSGSSDTITAKKIIGGNPATGEIMKYVEFEDAICVKQIFSPEIFNPEGGGVDWRGNLLVEGEIGATDNIYTAKDLRVDGAIVFSDGSRLTSANSVTTVNEDLLEEQQNTIQQQQETIASLEARIARLEEMLGINN
jgi:hypothetical protein